jgi:hypothetical protein
LKQYPHLAPTVSEVTIRSLLISDPFGIERKSYKSLELIFVREFRNPRTDVFRSICSTVRAAEALAEQPLMPAGPGLVLSRSYDCEVPQGIDSADFCVKNEPARNQ